MAEAEGSRVPGSVHVTQSPLQPAGAGGTSRTPPSSRVSPEVASRGSRQARTLTPSAAPVPLLVTVRDSVASLPTTSGPGPGPSCWLSDSTGAVEACTPSEKA